MSTLTLKNAKISVQTRADGSVRFVLYHGGLAQAIEMTEAEADDLGRSLLAAPEPPAITSAELIRLGKTKSHLVDDPRKGTA